MSQDTSREPHEDDRPENFMEEVVTDIDDDQDEPLRKLSRRAIELYRILYNEFKVRDEDFIGDARLRIEAFERQIPAEYVKRNRRHVDHSWFYDEDLEPHLENPVNLKLYTDGTALWEHFDKLEFFRILDAQTRFIYDHATKPITIQNQIRELPLYDSQKYYLLTALWSRFTEIAGRESWLAPTLDIIRAELKFYDFHVFREERVEEFKSFYYEDIAYLRAHLESLPSVRGKLIVLIKLRSDFQSALQRLISNTIGGEADQLFLRQIDLEIEKYQRILELEQSNTDVEADESRRVRAKDVGPKVLALDYLLRCVNAQGDKKNAWAPFVAFITGSTPGHVRPYLSNPYAPSERKPELWKQNMLQLRQFFSQMGLAEIVREIDRDISYFGTGAGSKEKKVSSE